MYYVVKNRIMDKWVKITRLPLAVKLGIDKYSLSHTSFEHASQFSFRELKMLLSCEDMEIYMDCYEVIPYWQGVPQPALPLKNLLSQEQK